MKKFLSTPEGLEFSLLNFIYALVWCNLFIGALWVFGITP